MVTWLYKDIIKLKVNGENAAFDDRSFYFSDKKSSELLNLSHSS